MARKLTDTKLRALRATGKIQKISDGGGLYIHVSPTGGKLWRFAYRFPDQDGGKRLQKTLALGVYPAVGLAEAREKAVSAKVLLAQGIDPAAKRKEEKMQAEANVRTFRNVAIEWDKRKNANLSSKYHAQILARLEKDIFPAFGVSPIAGITAPDIRQALNTIESRGAIETAHKVAQTIQRIFVFALACGYVPSNPAASLSLTLRSRPQVQHRKAELDPARLGALLRGMDAYTGAFSVRCALRLVPLLGCRSGELREAEWSEIDFSNAKWSIPGARMKARRPHTVLLSRQALAIFEDARKFATSETYVFPSVFRRKEGEKPVITDEGLLKALHSCPGGEELDIHGFRATFNTLVKEQLEGNPAAVEAALAHSKGSTVEKAYDHSEWIEKRRTMMQAWADYLDALKAGIDPAAAAERFRLC